ncbi:hypothetical protein E2C01_033503 [Portunus trituberculatus]|uniref:Reverse transcriptase zinc-binding domain-containing protein n=1 Tax=Portunus trituberculatus TaxID=210409 RepID=A0A5B7EY23_PORTR|nr:hypothetical protein [Portunus trituberculatus]
MLCELRDSGINVMREKLCSGGQCRGEMLLAVGQAAIARLCLGHTTLSAHLHCLRLSPDPFCPWCRTTPETIEHFLQHYPCFHSHRTALHSWLSTLGITTLDFPTLLAASGIHSSQQHAVLHLTCAFVRKTSQLPRL